MHDRPPPDPPGRLAATLETADLPLRLALRRVRARACLRGGLAGVGLAALHSAWTAGAFLLVWRTSLAASLPAKALFGLVWVVLMSIPATEVAHCLFHTRRPRSFAGRYVEMVRTLVLQIEVARRTLR